MKNIQTKFHSSRSCYVSTPQLLLQILPIVHHFSLFWPPFDDVSLPMGLKIHILGLIDFYILGRENNS